MVLGNGLKVPFLLAVELPLGVDQTEKVDLPGHIVGLGRFQVLLGRRQDPGRVEMGDLLRLDKLFIRRLHLELDPIPAALVIGALLPDPGLRLLRRPPNGVGVEGAR